MHDSLGDRMKGNYEARTQTHLMRRNYTIIRIDGKAFHTYTAGLEKPFDKDLMRDMDLTAAYLCKNIQGAKFAFVQSDEISLLLTDFDTLQTDAWFDYNVQKMCSVSASMATSVFNKMRLMHLFTRTIAESEITWKCLPKDSIESQKEAFFDSRVFQVPNKSEATNYFIWRQQDTTRNSIASVAQSLYSAKELHGVNTTEMQELIHQKGQNWNDLEPYYKRGRVIVKESFVHQQDVVVNEVLATTQVPSLRTHWVMKEVPIFTQETDFLSLLIPANE